MEKDILFLRKVRRSIAFVMLNKQIKINSPSRDGRYSISGSRTCHLAMNTLAKYHTLANISYSSYATDHFQDIPGTLKREVGYDHTSELQRGLLNLLRCGQLSRSFLLAFLMP